MISLQSSDKETGQLMSGIMQPRYKLHWPSTPLKQLIFRHKDIFWFFLKDEEFFSKTINNSNIDLDTYPASKVRQFAKKMESSKANTRHIKQVARDPQVAQISLM